MPTLPESLAAWRTEAFGAVLRRELARLPATCFALERFVRPGDRVLSEDLGFEVEAVDAASAAPRARIGVHFDVQVACCSCGDEPVIDAGHAVFELSIQPEDARVRLVPVL